MNKTVTTGCGNCGRKFFYVKSGRGRNRVYCDDCAKKIEREKTAARKRAERIKKANDQRANKPKHGAGYNPKKRGWPNEYDRSIDGKRYRLLARKRGGVSTETPNGKRGN